MTKKEILKQYENLRQVTIAMHNLIVLFETTFKAQKICFGCRLANQDGIQEFNATSPKLVRALKKALKNYD